MPEPKTRLHLFIVTAPTSRISGYLLYRAEHWKETDTTLDFDDEFTNQTWHGIPKADVQEITQEQYDQLQPMSTYDRLAHLHNEQPWRQAFITDANAREIQFCPYCGEKGTMKPGRNASVEVVNGGEVEETLGAEEQECTACDTRFFSI